MAKVELTGAVVIKGESFAAGDTVEADADLQKELIELGVAEEVKESKKETTTKKK